MSDIGIDLGRPVSGDVLELIIADHYRFEDLLRKLRDNSYDRDAVRRAFAALHVAHAEAEETDVYPHLRLDRAIDARSERHNAKEHAEGHEALLRVLELADTIGEEFDEAVEELSGLISHHLAEEELDILNRVRVDVPLTVRRELGERFAAARNARLDDDCGRIDRIRDIVARARQDGLLAPGKSDG